ncbi:unnamed protein product [Urochloa decumbens]|uniref:DUF6598 domain-containing protein n=1 Tax=Urochloa decumbens TaxID=240449 RepID=A0ABC9ERG1_9POAL
MTSVSSLSNRLLIFYYNLQSMRAATCFSVSKLIPNPLQLPIDPMRFTYDPPPPFARPCNTLQVYSVSVAATRGDLLWPLHVYGLVAVRDSVDRNRNLTFYRERDDCQTLTEKDQCLVLSGPGRAVVLLDPVTIEVELKVKGAIESEDKDLSLLAVPLIYSGGAGLRPFEYTSKLSTLEFMLGEIVSSVEATVFVRIIDGSWPDGFHGQFAAATSSIDHEKAILLEFGDDNVPVSADGIMKLSRHAVSVEVSGELKVSFKAWQDGCSKAVEGEVVFTPARAGRSFGNLHFGSCKMEVLVAWSLISPDPEPDY